MTPAIFALALALSTPSAFDRLPETPAATLSDPGGGDGEASILPMLAAVGVGALASGLLTAHSLFLRWPFDTYPNLESVQGHLVLVGVDFLAQWGLSHLLGVPRTALSALLGVGVGRAVAALVLWGSAAVLNVGYAGAYLAVATYFVAATLLPPVLTILDPLGFSKTPVPVSTRVLDARPVERT